MTSSIGRAGALRGAGVVALALGVLASVGVVSPPAARGDDRAQTRRALPDRTPSDVHVYQLRPVDDGTFFYDGDGFSAVRAADGAVQFHPQHWKARTSVGAAITNTGTGRPGKVWPVQLPDRLNEIWSAPGLTPAERRQVIYLLWQETTTDQVGTSARRIIAEFAEKNFPAGEAQRFHP